MYGTPMWIINGVTAPYIPSDWYDLAEVFSFNLYIYIYIKQYIVAYTYFIYRFLI